MIKKGHVEPSSQASRVQATHRSSLGLLRRQALTLRHFLRDNLLMFQTQSLCKRRTISAKIITEMRGADLIVFRINYNGNDCNSMQFKIFRVNKKKYWG